MCTVPAEPRIDEEFEDSVGLLKIDAVKHLSWGLESLDSDSSPDLIGLGHRLESQIVGLGLDSRHAGLGFGWTRHYVQLN